MQIKRAVFTDLVKELETPEILVLLGPRQVGKTTLLRALEKEVKRRGQFTKFLDLEQPSDLALLNGEHGDVVEYLSSVGDVVFVDEFYYLENAARVFKAVYDLGTYTRKKVKIVATGSSSIEIHRHLENSENLAGRSVIYRVSPLTFEEYLSWESEEKPEFRDYLRYGGLPGLCKSPTEDRKQRLLATYVNSYLLKDIHHTFDQEVGSLFRRLLLLIAENQGKIIDVEWFASELEVDSETIEACFRVLERAYTAYFLDCYHSNNGGPELRRSKKVYLYDLGIRNSILKDFRAAKMREDKEDMYRAHVLLSLIPNLAPNSEVKFWQTEDEKKVDFVLQKNRQPIPIAVTAHLNGYQVHPDIEEFCRRYENARETYTVSDEKRETTELDGRVHHYITFNELGKVLCGLD